MASTTQQLCKEYLPVFEAIKLEPTEKSDHRTFQITRWLKDKIARHQNWENKREKSRKIYAQ